MLPLTTTRRLTRALSTHSNAFLNVKLPDLWQPIAQIPVQIPYVPDFWDSSKPVANNDLEPQKSNQEPLPKLLVVAGADTHLNGGPSHNLLDVNAAPDPPVDTRSKSKAEGGIWDDMADDVGIPRPRELKTALWRVLY